MRKSEQKIEHSLAKQRDAALRHAVLTYYKTAGRHTLPWRETSDPYHILVSEVMLQQTQVDRVIPKYRAFIERFPSFLVLAQAPLRDVLVAWQGLGYNRRAKMLHACAQSVCDQYGGQLPHIETVLRNLPGIGAYTAAAIQAFAYNTAVALIETNVRTVYIHHYYPEETDISDAMLTPIIARTVDRDNPRHWYYALMDYGSHLKRTIGNKNIQSKHYAKQSSFTGSDRQIRGAIIRILGEGAVSRARLHRELPFEDIRIDAQLERLMSEGMIEMVRRSYQLPA